MDMHINIEIDTWIIDQSEGRDCMAVFFHVHGFCFGLDAPSRKTTFSMFKPILYSLWFKLNHW